MATPKEDLVRYLNEHGRTRRDKRKSKMSDAKRARKTARLEKRADKKEARIKKRIESRPVNINREHRRIKKLQKLRDKSDFYKPEEKPKTKIDYYDKQKAEKIDYYNQQKQAKTDYYNQQKQSKLDYYSSQGLNYKKGGKVMGEDAFKNQKD